MFASTIADRSLNRANAVRPDYSDFALYPENCATFVASSQNGSSGYNSKLALTETKGLPSNGIPSGGDNSKGIASNGIFVQPIGPFQPYLLGEDGIVYNFSGLIGTTDGIHWKRTCQGEVPNPKFAWRDYKTFPFLALPPDIVEHVDISYVEHNVGSPDREVYLHPNGTEAFSFPLDKFSKVGSESAVLPPLPWTSDRQAPGPLAFKKDFGQASHSAYRSLWGNVQGKTVIAIIGSDYWGQDGGINVNSRCMTRDGLENISVSAKYAMQMNHNGQVLLSTEPLLPGDKRLFGFVLATPINKKLEPEDGRPLPGDILVYKDGGLITFGRIYGHVAIIVEGGVKKNLDGTWAVTRVRSKWGSWGVYEHNPDDCRYGLSWTVWHRKQPLKDWDKNPIHRNYLGTVDANGVSHKGLIYTDKGRLINTTKPYSGSLTWNQVKKELNLHGWAWLPPYVYQVNPDEVNPMFINYDCRGFVFAYSKATVSDTQVIKDEGWPTDQIQMILDDGYEQITTAEHGDGHHP